LLSGAQAEGGFAQTGGMLAAVLDYPFASLVDSIEILDGNKLGWTGLCAFFEEPGGL
jgi:electron transfer flavoprotein beta subunit